MNSPQINISLKDVKDFIACAYGKSLASTYKSAFNGFWVDDIDFDMILKKPYQVAQLLKDSGVSKKKAHTMFKTLKIVFHKMMDDSTMKDRIGDVCNIDITSINSFNQEIIKPVFVETIIDGFEDNESKGITELMIGSGTGDVNVVENVDIEERQLEIQLDIINELEMNNKELENKIGVLYKELENKDKELENKDKELEMKNKELENKIGVLYKELENKDKDLHKNIDNLKRALALMASLSL